MHTHIFSAICWLLHHTFMSSAPTRMDVATQTELSQKNTAIQVSSCREWQSLSPLMDGSSENSCVRCWPARWSAQPDGRAARGSGKVKEHLGVWERGRLVEPCSAFSETETGSRQKNKDGLWFLLEATWSKGSDERHLTPATGGIVLIGSRPAGVLQPPQQLLEKQHGTLYSIQETLRMH